MVKFSNDGKTWHHGKLISLVAGGHESEAIDQDSGMDKIYNCQTADGVVERYVYCEPCVIMPEQH